MAEAWQPVQLDTDGVPQLILKARLDDTGYHVQISDLSRVWQESLSKEGVIKRASDSGCSIDVSSANDQYHRLLEEIDNAFKRRDGTTLNMRQSRNGPNLELDATAPLPGSLPPLRWTFELSQLNARATASDIVIPLLRQAKDLRDQIDQLIARLKDKDHVIEKVTDELEKAGHDLNDVFPRLKLAGRKTNRRSSQREQLGHLQPGLAEFDKETWRTSLIQDSEAQMLSSNTIDMLLDDITLVKDRSNANSSAWWENLNSTNIVARVDRHEHRHVPTNKETQMGKAIERSVEESQHEEMSSQHQSRESTPSTKDGETDTEVNTHGQVHDEDETTEDDEVFDAPPSRDSSQTKGRSQPTEKSGASPVRSGKKVSTRKGSGSLSPPLTKQRLKLGSFRGKGKSKSPTPAEALDERREAQEQHQQPKPKSKLGSFAGKRQASTPTTPIEVSRPKPTSKLGTFAGRNSNQPSVDPGNAQAGSPPKTQHRLGVFKAKGSEQGPSALDADEEESTRTLSRGGDAPELPVTSADGEEHSAQPANKAEEVALKKEAEEPPEQKREKLKRELVEKSKAPVRKKRKF